MRALLARKGFGKKSSRQLLALLIHQQLFTSARFPISQSKSIRTSNAIERLHEEFKRRIKTQTVLPSAEGPIKTRQSRSLSATQFSDRIGF
jgi:transposase-like protein